ncbi:MAG: sporulation protein YqfD [Clostridiales bacterium]|nr:sporulation protein YqfD [Clostridiales bacterium]
MLLLRFLHFFLGYVRFKAWGDFPERLLNLCAGRGVPVWGIVRRKGRIEGMVYAKDYKKMRKIRARSGARLRIMEKRGLPFILRRYRKRVGLLVGFVLFFLILRVMSGFIWTVEIVGNQRVEKAEILAALERVGIEEGVPISSIDPANVRQRLMLELPELAWAAVNIEGAKATVDVKETRQVPDKIDDSLPCNLKAARDGRIIGHQVTDGRIMVQIGDAVVAGDLLVSGVMEYADGESGFKHAAGQVFAETQRAISYTARYDQQETYRTGQVRRRRALKLFGLEIPLYLGSVRGTYEKEIETHQLAFGTATLPISVVSASFYETAQLDYTLDEAGALEFARQQIAGLEREQLQGAEILSKEEQIETTEEGVALTVQYVCKENIAVEEILSISTTNE